MCTGAVDSLTKKDSPKQDTTLRLNVPNKENSLSSVSSPLLDSPDSAKDVSSKSTFTSSTASIMSISPLNASPALSPDSTIINSPANASPTAQQSLGFGHNGEYTQARAQAMMTRTITSLNDFLEKALGAHTSSITKILNGYTIGEIQKIRNLLGFKDNASWNRQLNYWLHPTDHLNASEHSVGLRYHGTFHDALIERIKEERNLATLSNLDVGNLPQKSIHEIEYDNQLANQHRAHALP
jgi:hypothetical protein